MGSCFRSEIFTICKQLQKNSKCNDIRNVLHKTSNVCADEKDRSDEKFIRPNIIYYGKQMRHQFYGFLYLDDETYSNNTETKFKVEHLTQTERILLERGHKTLNRFVELCTNDIKGKMEIVGEALDPYFLFNEVSCSDQIKPLLSDEELQKAVAAFKRGQNYKTLFKADLNILYDNINRFTMQTLIKAVEEQITKCYQGEVPASMNRLSLAIRNGDYCKQNDALIIFTALICALRDSLALACQMIYLSIYGGDIFVLNNENIINIEKEESTLICDITKVLIQGFCIDAEGNKPGNIILMDCDQSKEKHIHKFGMINSVTSSSSNDSGNTTKFTFITLNDELITINGFTENSTFL